MYWDLRTILEEHGEHRELLEITVKPGQHDLTRWARIRRKYGRSIIRTHGKEEYNGNIADWRRTETEDFKVYIRIDKTERVPEEAWTELEEWKDKLETAPDELIAVVANKEGQEDDRYVDLKKIIERE